MKFIDWFFGIKKAPELERLQFQLDNYKPEIITLGYQSIQERPLSYVCTYRSCCGNFKWSQTIPVIYNLYDSYEYYSKRLYRGWRIESLKTRVDGCEHVFYTEDIIKI